MWVFVRRMMEREFTLLLPCECKDVVVFVDGLLHHVLLGLIIFDLISHIDFSLLKLISSLSLSPIRSLHGVDNERCLMEREAALTMCKQSSIGTPFLE